MHNIAELLAHFEAIVSWTRNENNQNLKIPVQVSEEEQGESVKFMGRLLEKIKHS